MEDRLPLLQEYLAQLHGRMVEPGVFDCALMAGGWVHVLTGVDLTERFVGTYSTFQEGRTMLRKEGLRSIAELAETLLEEVHGWHRALPGDIAIVKEKRLLAFGLVSGEHIHVLAYGGGTGVLPLSRAIRVFRP